MFSFFSSILIFSYSSLPWGNPISWAVDIVLNHSFGLHPYTGVILLSHVISLLIVCVEMRSRLIHHLHHERVNLFGQHTLNWEELSLQKFSCRWRCVENFFKENIVHLLLPQGKSDLGPPQWELSLWASRPSNLLSYFHINLDFYFFKLASRQGCYFMYYYFFSRPFLIYDSNR